MSSAVLSGSYIHGMCSHSRDSAKAQVVWRVRPRKVLHEAAYLALRDAVRLRRVRAGGARLERAEPGDDGRVLRAVASEPRARLRDRPYREDSSEKVIGLLREIG